MFWYYTIHNENRYEHLQCEGCHNFRRFQFITSKNWTKLWDRIALSSLRFDKFINSTDLIEVMHSQLFHVFELLVRILIVTKFDDNRSWFLCVQSNVLIIHDTIRPFPRIAVHNDSQSTLHSTMQALNILNPSMKSQRRTDVTMTTLSAGQVYRTIYGR
jgi:exosortase/archaeosortase